MAYTRDAAGNRQSLTVSGTENYVTTYNYDANNRLIKSSKKNSGASYSDVMYYSYDNNGNQTRIDKSRDKGTGKMELGIYSVDENSGYGYELFTYDGFNRLIKYGDEKNNTASYEYLSNGLRLSKTVNGEKTSFIWDGDNIQFTVSSDETVSYSRAPGYMRRCTTKDMADGVAAKNRESTLYLYNGHGDVTVTTNKDGNIKKTYEYDAFGNEINPDSNDTNPFRYCGEYYDGETESIYLRARYYNMSTGRFISEDPIKDGLNWYSYASQNPIMFWDPLGLFDYNTRLSYSQTYNEDVEVLQNELVYLGYMSAPEEDEWGYFGLKTQAAVNAYKNDMGLGNTGENYGVVGLQTWTSLGLIYRTKEDIDAGVKIVMIGGRKQYKDVSIPINNALNNSRSDFEAHSGDYVWFYNQVKSGAPWDIKLEKNWKSTIGSTYPGGYSTKVVLFGQITTPEELGNITYGYLGSAAGFSEFTLLKGADAAAAGVDLSVKGILKGIGGAITGADSEEDKNNVKIGINWYNNR